VRSSRLILTWAPLLVMAGTIIACRPATDGCTNDTDCKGTRICDHGACRDPSPGSPSSAPHAEIPAAHPTTTGQRGSNTPTCAACPTQEDFDAALKRGQKCCPVTTCKADSECLAGRVCCRIPDGQICADAARCAAVNRTEARGARDAASFACGKSRCRAGQLCCPATSRCAADGGCDDPGAGTAEVADYEPFSYTTVGYECNPKTNEPCASGETCRISKVGHGPLTMTSHCAR
jgi:hypothetical protein